MPALMTQTDREIHRLQILIEQQRRWLREESGDRRAAAFHRARLTELESELEKIEERS
jgi:hypothetical protein